MIKQLIILSVLMPGVALASDTWINFHIGSVHNKSTVKDDNGKEYEIDGFNPGIGIEFPVIERGYPSESTSYRFGVVKNSYSKLSAYAGLDFHSEYTNTNGFGAGVTFGVIAGYKDSPADRNIIPGIIPRLMYVYKDYRAETSFIYGRHASAIALTVGVRY